ncbi:MAG TPA: hypothetical protein VEQ41_02270, partial [Solirubrobacterales bacterium]|nr:hypothetical protein [Solirubrobacterales bacterium]
ATGVFSADDIAINAGVGCYEKPSLQASAAIFQAAADPVAKCAKVWREGVLGDEPGSPPHLVACAADGTPVFVFPGADDVCDRLGLQPLPDDYAPRGIAHARAFAALHRIGELPPPGSPCVSPQAAAERARDRLPSAYSDVEVRIEGGGPCAREYRPVGDHIGVRTVSRAEGAILRIGVRVSVALRRLHEQATSGGCHPPAQVARKARRLLAATGLGEIEVRIEGTGPCVVPGFGADGEYRWVSFVAGPPPRRSP